MKILKLDQLEIDNEIKFHVISMLLIQTWSM